MLTLVGQSQCYSHNPDRQSGKPLLPVLRTLICRSWGSNVGPPAHEADALTTRPPRWSTLVQWIAYCSLKMKDFIKPIRIPVRSVCISAMHSSRTFLLIRPINHDDNKDDNTVFSRNLLSGRCRRFRRE